ncbi:MAG TPA: 4Fe-4S binding protein [Gemmataceae bacterium]|nr:4Fe-4S binding protein [Gemmataceae bacterium]
MKPAVPELPLLDETRCTGCGDCVWVCPTRCLELGAPLPWLARPRDCISCTLCALVCPVEAIRLGLPEES